MRESRQVLTGDEWFPLFYAFSENVKKKDYKEVRGVLREVYGWRCYNVLYKERKRKKRNRRARGFVRMGPELYSEYFLVRAGLTFRAN